ncbi:hypothetical protein K0M31_015987 [Melipona bicolor]|uniref:Uncharacterized protein n=1 Tax=Melipona bicolor TaxID=60889 RepID=A0AA40G643_9HYME|nr:hypothetical protein K0M31_015987 [Melipona bicolor]
MSRSLREVIQACSGTEQPTSGRTLRLGSWNTVTCRESPDIMAHAYLWDIYLTPRSREYSKNVS